MLENQFFDAMVDRPIIEVSDYLKQKTKTKTKKTNIVAFFIDCIDIKELCN